MKDVVFIGPKHSGKTSAGKAFASLCSGDFFDIDELILQRTGKTPRQLFNESPETFQKAEAAAAADIFRSVINGRQRVIATGGGIIDNNEAVAILKKSGARLAYLNITADAAWQRIVSAEELPPFLKTDDPQGTHLALHERRAAAYLRLADIVINVEGKTPHEIAMEVFNHGWTTAAH